MKHLLNDGLVVFPALDLPPFALARHWIHLLLSAVHQDLGKKIGGRWELLYTTGFNRDQFFFYFSNKSFKWQGTRLIWLIDLFIETDTRLASVFDPNAGQERVILILRGAWLWKRSNRAEQLAMHLSCDRRHCPQPFGFGYGGESCKKKKKNGADVMATVLGLTLQWARIREKKSSPIWLTKKMPSLILKEKSSDSYY